MITRREMCDKRWMSYVFAMLIAATMVLLFIPMSVYAADPVCHIGSNSYDSIQDAVSNAADGDTIYVTTDANISNTITISNKSLSIVGETDGLVLGRDTAFTGTMFNLNPNAELSLSNITLDGGAIWSDSSMTASAAETRTNSGVSATGSLITCSHYSTLNLNNNAILQNNCGYCGVYQGAAVSVHTNSSMNMNSGSVIQRCTCLDPWQNSKAGAIYLGGNTTGNDFEVTYLTIDGGIIQGCAIVNHGNCGSAITGFHGANIVLKGNTKICNNWNDDSGNGCSTVVAKSTALVIEDNCEISDNINTLATVLDAYYDLWPNYGSLAMDGNASIHDNYSSVNVGGLYTTVPTSISGNTAIYNNSTDGLAGGVYVGSSGFSFVMGDNAKIYGNSAGTSGGGLYVSGSADVSMNGGEITDNKAGTYGGGVIITSNSRFVMDATGAPKIYNNTATTGADDVHKVTTTSTATLITVSEMQLPSSVAASDWYYDNDGARYRDITAAKTAYDGSLSSITAEVKLTVGIQYTVTYDTNNATSGTVPVDTNAPYGYNAKATVLNQGDLARTGYTFDGWNTSADGTGTSYSAADTFSVTENTVLYAQWKANGTIPVLNTTDHFQYIYGYSNGTVQPEGNITRAETATIIYRLLTAERRDEIFTSSNDFSDVTNTLWYNKAVSSMANGNYVVGYDDGTFKGNNDITRAEFITMLVRFIGVTDSTSDFTDVSTDHWAYHYIATAANAGWIEGYSDGSFRPDQLITRAEAITIINRVLNRGVDEAGISATGFTVWPDNDSSAWYYYEVIEATNNHEYTGSRPNETWTSLTIDYTYDLDHYERP